MDLTGSATIPQGVTLTIPKEQTLTIPEDKDLINNGTIINNGRIVCNGIISGNGKLEGNQPELRQITLNPKSVTVAGSVGMAIEAYRCV